MKNVSLAILFAALSLTGMGQYKKAGFFSKKGRTIGIGTTSFIMGDGKGAPVGFYYEGSRESTERRIFTYGNIAVIPGYKFSFQTTGVSYDQTSEKNITVSGKTTMHFLYQFNVGYFLLKQGGGEERKFRPFVSAGFNVLLGGRLKEETYEDGYEINKDTGGQSFSTGLRGGAGCIYDLSQKFSLKLDGGYTYQVNIYPSDVQGYQTYSLFTSHASVSLGIRYSIFSE